MPTFITDPDLEHDLITRRQAWGGDRFDEVWDGVYVMAPWPNDEHQFLVKELTTILTIAIDWQKLGQTRPGVNISDRRANWKDNYRVPDVAVFLNDSKAENCGSFWFGGPEFGIEIVSEGDRIRDKLPFYASVGTLELLVVDRDPWKLTLYRNDGNRMAEAATSTFDSPAPIPSQVLPLTWQLVSDSAARSLRVAHQQQAQQVWQIELPAYN